VEKKVAGKEKKGLIAPSVGGGGGGGVFGFYKGKSYSYPSWGKVAPTEMGGHRRGRKVPFSVRTGGGREG